MRPDLLILDNYDSFTWNLAHLFGTCGAEVTVVRNDAAPVDDLLARAWTHVVISPGPGVPERAGVAIDLVLATLARRLPLLGVCLGHQALGVALGAKVRRVSPPVHGETSPLRHDGRGLFQGVPQGCPVARYHSLVLDAATLPRELVVDARCEDDADLVMAVRHRGRPAFGVQFHPESFMTTWGKVIASRFLKTRGEHPR